MKTGAHPGLYLAVLLAAVSPLAWAYTYDPDYLIQDLYDRLSELEDDYQTDELDNRVPEVDKDARSDWPDIAVDPRDYGETTLRDQEHLDQPSKWGFQYISGGAGEGTQHLTPGGKQNNTHEVKSDEALPFYCHPPNPCPKGYTEKDGCEPRVKDTADEQKEWIQRMQMRGKCACDEEHMFSCPRGQETVNSQDVHKDALDQVIDSLLGDKNDQNPYAGGEKREKVVAKKSPIVKRMAEVMPNSQPGTDSHGKLKRVAKKGGSFNM